MHSKSFNLNTLNVTQHSKSLNLNILKDVPIFIIIFQQYVKTFASITMSQKTHVLQYNPKRVIFGVLFLSRLMLVCNSETNIHPRIGLV